MIIIKNSSTENSPLRVLLAHCIGASVNGHISDLLDECLQINGWDHKFNKFLGSGFSEESLEIKDEETKNKLIEIVSKHISSKTS